ncbi:MAG TPA: recombinase-like helix-turn-helix domain-containing protein [Stellaceae bacterium]|nr:recombinase-like helix-turn-helix domain-containing protein [Stellaceae bacterium]
MDDHNPGLTPDQRDKGSEAGIENPDRVRNVAWQTRAAPPTPAEIAFADALQSIFAEEIYDLPGIVAKLNGRVPSPAGAPRWTEAVLAAELARLGR